jgi:tRNA threonylcarbamoyladenosine biosynthesis protein TsaE
MTSFLYEAKDEQETAAFGAALADALPAGSTIALHGTLGAGKTRLVQAIAERLGVDRENVTSPTFVLIQEHHGRIPIYHIDAYRMRDEDEFLALGPEEYFEGQGIVLIEWAERVEKCLPYDRLEIELEVTGDASRRFKITVHGEKLLGILDNLRKSLLNNANR